MEASFGVSFQDEAKRQKGIDFWSRSDIRRGGGGGGKAVLFLRRHPFLLLRAVASFSIPLTAPDVRKRGGNKIRARFAISQLF